MLGRYLNLPNLLKRKSFFLFGPRETGKSSLIKAQLAPTYPVINLLESQLFLHLSNNPGELEPVINAFPRQDWVIIDEVQRIPPLLNEVHRLIEDRGIRFLLTGSSARKLKKQDTNLLGGRAWKAELFPLISEEIPDFDIHRYLRYGGLPPIYLSDEPNEELYAYVDTYLKEEIRAESLVRNIPSFSRFLEMSALTSGTLLNFASISNDTGIAATTIREYYQILEDTFIGFMVPAWTKTIKRKALSTAKFYYFDIGVKNTLAGIKYIEEKSNVFGQAFENFIAMELRAYLSYNRIHEPLSYWQSKHGIEVDFIMGDTIAIEVKSTDKVSDKHLKGLKMLAEEKICKRYILISFDKLNRRYGNIDVLHWKDFLKKLWDDEFQVSK